jgi:hypothetical protein
MPLCKLEPLLGSGPDRIEHGFRLGKIQSTVQESALGEFARLSQTCARRNTGVAQAGQDQSASMAVKFHYIFCCKRSRPLHVDHQAFIEDLMCRGGPWGGPCSVESGLSGGQQIGKV